MSNKLKNLVAVGSVSVIAGGDVSLTGQEATFSLGSIVVTAGADVAVTGQSATFSLGSVSVTGGAVVEPTGQSATFILNYDRGWGWFIESGDSSTETWTIERAA